MKLSKIALAQTVLSNCSREELRHVARNLGLPTGRNKKDTLFAVSEAVAHNKVHFSAHVFLRTRRNWRNGKYVPGLGETQETLFAKRIRTHRPDQTDYVKPSFPKSRS